MLLWCISPLDQPGKNSFVFGTMHVHDRRVCALGDAVLPLIDACEVFAAEYELTSRQKNYSPDLLSSVPTLAQLTAHWPERKWNRLHRGLLNYFSFELSDYLSLPPFFAATAFTYSLYNSESPFLLDEKLWRYAEDRGKILRGLETEEDQWNTLRNIPQEKFLKTLVVATRSPVRFRHNAMNALKHYLQGNIQQLNRSTRKSLGELRQTLLFHRNLIFAREIAWLSGRHSLFAAIGAAHLAGGKGVLHLLGTKGFKVKPIPLPSRD